MGNLFGKISPDDFKYKFDDPEFLTDYRGCMVPYPMYETLPDVETVDVTEDDIVICTFPKCGTTFMSGIVLMIHKDGDPLHIYTEPTLEEKVPYLELTFPTMEEGERPIDKIKKSNHPRIYYTHLSYKAMPKQILSKCKIVYVAANPKDTICGMHGFISATVPMQFDGTMDDTIQSFEDDRAIYSPFFDHVADFWDASKTQSNIFFTTFEDMVKDTPEVIQKLGLFLGRSLSKTQISAIHHHTHFEQMKDNEIVNREKLADAGYWDFSVSEFMDEGGVGNWKKALTPEQNERVEKWIAKEEARVNGKLDGFEFQYE